MKKDLNYIAAVEKAIKKKYGSEAIDNPAKFWDEEKEKDYLEQLEELVTIQRGREDELDTENVDGVLITHKLLNKEVNFNCPVCLSKINTINDDIYMIKFSCCEKCFIQHVEHREQRWKEGWRPKDVRKNT